MMLKTLQMKALCLNKGSSFFKIYVHIERKYSHLKLDIYKSTVANNPAKNILDEIKALFDIIEVLNSKIYKV